MEDISEALKEDREGKSRKYHTFISHLSNPNIPDSELVSALGSLRKSILLLGREYETLVGVILKINWTDKSETAVKQYQGFVLNLVSAHTFYLQACLRMIATKFMPGKPDTSNRDNKGEPDEETRKFHQQQFSYLHSLLQAIVKIVPLMSQILIPLLDDCFPFLGVNAYIQQCYVANLLKVTAYLPSCRQSILEIIVHRLTKLDVRAPRDEIEDMEDDSEDDDLEEDIFKMDEDGPVGADPLRGEELKPMSHPEADRLDATLHVVLQYIHTVCYKQGELNWESTKKLYRELLTVFNKLILPTHASCHVQYLMFYMCSFKQPLVEGFLDFLWKQVHNPNTQPIFRQAAVAYMASLVARATYIPVSTAKDTLQLMVSWIHKYIEMTSHTDTPVDVKHHGPFYSVCQAVFYLFAFRHKEILADKKGYKYSQKLNLQTIVTSRLNPLKFCLPVVVKTFSSITRMHQLVLCDTIIERNRRCLLPVQGYHQAQPSRVTVLNPLDSFFPFDPCLLIRSRRYIVPLYREYEGVPVQEQEPQILNEDELYDDCQEMQSLSITPGSIPVKSPKTPTDFLTYGISPGFKHV